MARGTGYLFRDESSWTIEIEGAIAQNAVFYPGVLVSASAGGHVSYSYSSAAGVVEVKHQRHNISPAATSITLTAVPIPYSTFSGVGQEGQFNIVFGLHHRGFTSRRKGNVWVQPLLVGSHGVRQA